LAHLPLKRLHGARVPVPRVHLPGKTPFHGLSLEDWSPDSSERLSGAPDSSQVQGGKSVADSCPSEGGGLAQCTWEVRAPCPLSPCPVRILAMTAGHRRPGVNQASSASPSLSFSLRKPPSPQLGDLEGRGIWTLAGSQGDSQLPRHPGGVLQWGTCLIFPLPTG
jgi:hypothetical protein